MLKKIILYLMISSLVLANKKNVMNFNGADFEPDFKTVEKFNPQKPIWIPVLEIVAFNLLLGSYNKYVTESDFAQINTETIKANFKAGWGWDADDFTTNMWKHPFQGSIYFNTARSNGYNYWISLLMASFGSLHWEYFMEIEHPSINDFITTSLQGAIFGEVFYRISSLVIDETTPKKRVWRELGVTGFNPGRAVNRVIYGRSFRVINENLYTTKPYKLNFIMGVNDHSQSNYYKTQKRRGFIGFNYFYGDLFRQKKYTPLDIFSFETEFQFKPEFSIVKFRIFGILLGKAFNLNQENNINSKFIIGLFHYTDFLRNDVFDIGAVNIGPGISYLSPSFWYTSRVIVTTTIAFMPMSAVNSNYAKEFIPKNFDEGRNYNLSTGLSLRGRIIFTSKYLTLKLTHSFWAFWTLQGAKGKEFINIFEPTIVFKISKHIKTGIGGLLYYRNGKYGDFPNILMSDRELRGFLSLIF